MFSRYSACNSAAVLSFDSNQWYTWLSILHTFVPTWMSLSTSRLLLVVNGAPYMMTMQNLFSSFALFLVLHVNNQYSHNTLPVCSPWSNPRIRFVFFNSQWFCWPVWISWKKESETLDDEDKHFNHNDSKKLKVKKQWSGTDTIKLVVRQLHQTGKDDEVSYETTRANSHDQLFPSEMANKWSNVCSWTFVLCSDPGGLIGCVSHNISISFNREWQVVVYPQRSVKFPLYDIYRIT